MLQALGDLRLGQEPRPADRTVGVAVEDALQGDHAVQLLVQRHENHHQPAPSMRPQDAEAAAVTGGGADGVRGRALGFGLTEAGSEAGHRGG